MTGNAGEFERRRLARGLKVWCALAVAGIGTAVQSARAQCQYEAVVIEGPPCGIFPSRDVQFYGLNDLGQACGWQAKCGGGGDGDPLPIVWTPELGVVLLPLPEGALRGWANDINGVLGTDGFGEVACTIVFGSPIFAHRAALYRDGEWTILSPDNGTHSEAFAIGDLSEVAGYRDVDRVRHAFVWQDGEFIEVESPIGGTAITYDLNASGEAAGFFGVSSGSGLGFIWSGAEITEIPPLPGASNSEAHGVNRWTVATGDSRIPVKSGPTGRRAWVYNSGVLTELDPFPNMLRCFANDINDARQIVGKCSVTTGGGPAFLWQDGVAYNPNDLFDIPPNIPGIGTPTAINDRGQIAAWTSGTTAPESRGVILTPIDRPLGDVDINCKVDAWDLALLLGNWGPCPEVGSCMMDFVNGATFQPPGDGLVDAADLAVVLGNWSPPSPSSFSSPTTRRRNQ